MKNIKHLVFLFCIGLMVLSSCKKSIPPHLKAVPGNAAFVIAFENKQMMSKGGLTNIKDYKFFEKIREQVKVDNAETQKMIDKFLEDPKSSGLDLDQSYLFAVKQDSGFYGSMVFKMDNMETFENNAKELVKLKDSAAFNIEDKGKYKIVQMDEGALAWNKELAFIVGGENCRTVNYDELFAMPQEKSIVSVADFNDFNKGGYDIGFWASYGAITDMVAGKVNMEKPAIWKDLSDSYIHSYLNFNNGEVKFTGLMTPTSKVKDFLAKYPVIKNDFDNGLMRAFPEKSYLAFKLSINVQEYIKMLREVSLQMDADLPIDQMMLNNPTANTIINALGGDMLLSVYGFAQGPLPIPLSGLGFTVKSKDDFDKLLAMVPQEMVKQSGDYYVISTGMMVSLYFAYKDNKVYITDDADAIASFTGKGFDKQLGSSPLGKSMNKCPYLFYINLDADSYPENVRNLLQSEMGAKAAESLKLLAPYKDFSISMTDDYEMSVSLKFKDASQNSLKQMLKNWDEMAASQQY